MNEWNPQVIRDALGKFVKRAKVGSLTKWEDDAGLSEGVLRKFLAGKTKDIHISQLAKLASARGVTISDLLGERVHHRGDTKNGAADVVDEVKLHHARAQVDRLLGEIGMKPESIDPEQYRAAVAALYARAFGNDGTDLKATVLRVLMSKVG
jgi:hypothetical protein